MKVVTALFLFESNTFNPEPAELELFTVGGSWCEGDEQVRAWCRGSDSQLRSGIETLDAAGCETRGAFVAVCGTPAGRLSPSCFKRIRDAFLQNIRACLPADALLLHLHGAACAEGIDDVEGHLLSLVRVELGFDGYMAITLDLHANVTRLMLDSCDAITAYRTMPHMDFHETGVRGARLVLSGFRTERSLAKLGALIPPTRTSHLEGSFSRILERARGAELDPGIIDISVFPVQPWMDISEMGSAIVVTARPGFGGAALARKLAYEWFDLRADWNPRLLPWDAIRASLGSPRPDGRPWILVDAADATTGGSSGFSSVALKELWPHRDRLAGEVLLWVVDPHCQASFASGAAQAFVGTEQVEISGDVLFRGEAVYRAKGQAYHGQRFSAGNAVVVAAGQLRIVVTERPLLNADPAFFACVGLTPHTALAVQVKSLMGWVAGYAAVLEQGLIFDGAGSTSLHFERLPYTGERRGLHPINTNPVEPVTLWKT